MNKIFLFVIFSLFACHVLAEEVSNENFTWTVYNGNGELIDTLKRSYQGSAPITAVFQAEYPDAVYYGSWCRWKKGGQMENPDISNPNNPTEFTFNTAGTDSVAFVGYMEYSDTDGSTVRLDITPDFVRSNECYFVVRTYESKLIFPNAFSPNGDTYNEIYKAKEAQSIIEFNAKIFNRWGQKLYEWNNVNGGWDGKYHGKPVKDGVYYVQVKAKGADGQEFVIKKAVNLMRGFLETTDSNTSTTQ